MSKAAIFNSKGLPKPDTTTSFEDDKPNVAKFSQPTNTVIKFSGSVELYGGKQSPSTVNIVAIQFGKDLEENLKCGEFYA